MSFFHKAHGYYDQQLILQYDQNSVVYVPCTMFIITYLFLDKGLEITFMISNLYHTNSMFYVQCTSLHINFLTRVLKSLTKVSKSML